MKIELTREQVRDIVVLELEAYSAFCEDTVTLKALKTVITEYNKNQPDNTINEVIEKDLDGC